MKSKSMDNAKDDSYDAKQAVGDMDKILQYTHGLDPKEFVKDEEALDAVMFRFVQVAENIRHPSPTCKERHPDVPWGLIMGFRDGIVRDDGKTDYSIVVEIVDEDLSALREALAPEGNASD